MSSTTFLEKTIKSWDEFYSLEEDSWIYRGQRDFKWTLQSSIERLCDKIYEYFGRNLSRSKYRSRVEKSLLREFKRRCHQYEISLPQFDDDLEWLALMQHYGAPTRLLDWSYSIFIALYFSLENAAKDKDSAIWALNGKWCRSKAAKLFPQKYADQIEKPLMSPTGIDIRKIFFSPRPKKFVVSVNPYRLNKRLTIQRGLFLCPGDISISFEENICAMDEYYQNIIKYKVPHNKKYEFLKKLYSINISRTTLFPGLEGYAQSLNVYNFFHEHPYDL